MILLILMLLIDESKIKFDEKDFNGIDIYYLGYEYKKKNYRM